MVSMTAALVALVPLALAVFAGQMERLESAVLDQPTDPVSTGHEEYPEEVSAAAAANRGTDIRAEMTAAGQPSEEVTSTR